MRTRLLLSLLGLAFGSSILIISLFSATQVSSTDGQAASESKLYFSQEILPDHSLYKVMMAMDRVQLETSTVTEQNYMRLEYANRRLEYTKALLEKGNDALAVTTLQKSQNYLHQAIQAALADDAEQSSRQRVLTTLEYHSAELRRLAPKFTDASRAHIDKLLKEHETLHSSLSSKIPQTQSKN